MISAISIGRFYTSPCFAGRRKCFVKDVDGKAHEANVRSPYMSKYYWYIEKDGETLGDMQCSKSSSSMKGDNYPEYYKGKEYLFINQLHSNRQYKGIGTELIRTAVHESQKMGLGGRVCLNASMTKPKMGNPIPFYYKMGFESCQKEVQRKIEDSIQRGEPLPKECQSTSMFLPEDKIRKELDSNLLKNHNIFMFKNVKSAV